MQIFTVIVFLFLYTPGRDSEDTYDASFDHELEEYGLGPVSEDTAVCLFIYLFNFFLISSFCFSMLII